jgi:hypothetical protein
MKYVLDLRDYVTKINTDKKDTNECFYRYNILDCDDNIIAVVWFTQMEDSGNIYSVYVRILPEEFEGFDIYVTYADKYYPQAYEISIPHRKLSDDYDVKEYIKKLQLVNLIAHNVMDILKEKEHRQKYLLGALNRLKPEV